MLANDPRADIDGFLAHPATGAVEAVVVTAARTELVPLGEAGARIVDELGRARRALLAARGRGSDESFEVRLTSRTRADGTYAMSSLLYDETHVAPPTSRFSRSE